MQQLARTPKDVGHALRWVRKQKNMSQQELATHSGIWQETISRIENGSAGTRLDTLFDLCAALDLEIQLIDRSKSTANHLEETLRHGAQT